MAKIDFPSPATQGDTYTQNNLSWVYNGEAWDPTPADAAAIDDTAYGISWDGSVVTAPSQNAVYDKIETLGGGADDTAYGISWDGDTTTAPSKNAVYDKIETLGVGGGGADDTAYGASWNGDTTTAPSKNAVYDKIETLGVGGGGGGTVQNANLSIEPTDDGTTSGNARAQSAVDLQTSRALATQVASGVYSVIGGGIQNEVGATAQASTISGGYKNTVSAYYTTISGGYDNSIDNQSISSAVGGGLRNEITNGEYGVIGGGSENLLTNTDYSSVLGGDSNIINTTSNGSRNAIAGGETNEIQGSRSFIGGGQSNLITTTSTHAVITGGKNNGTGSGFYGMSSCFIGAGENNTMCGYDCFIGGGYDNDIDGFFGGSSSTSIVGGTTNSAYYCTNSVILGGRGNSATQSNYSVLSGRRSVVPVNLNGVFIYADSTDADFTADIADSAQFRVANGFHSTGPLFLTERASALTDIATKGQLWVKTATPNQLFFTDDAGEDMSLSAPVGTVAQLPTPAVQGMRAFVTDSGSTLASHHGQTVGNGGSNFVPVFYDGSSWIVG